MPTANQQLSKTRTGIKNIKGEKLLSLLSPFGCDLQLLSLVNRLRETGHFTAVSVTRPFEFEGQRKVDAADRMIAALEEAAHLVVVVEQV